MKRHLAHLLILALSLFPREAQSQPDYEGEVAEVVVTATRLETPVQEVSGTIIVITSTDIEAKQARTVADALTGFPGIDLVNQGGLGKTSSVLLRGGHTRFTLVLIDGVEVNDPSNPERTFDFAHMTTDDIDRIEVLFGPQSTLYGSDAIGGVIQIFTKKGEGRPRVVLSAESGSLDTRRGHAVASGRTGKAAWSVSASRLETGGISAASDAEGNTERDGYGNTAVSARMSLDLGGGAELQVGGGSADAENDLDAAGGPGGDDPNYTGSAKHERMFARLSIFPARIWEASLAVFGNVHERHDLNLPDPDRDYTTEMTFKGWSRKIELVNNLYLGSRSVVTVGFDSEKEAGESSYFSDLGGFPYTSIMDEESATVDGAFFQEQYTARSGLTLTVGGRTDDHSDFGREATWRAGFSAPLSGAARVRGAYGTGFRAPSIDQLYNPDYGSPDLAPEKSRGWDLGVESRLGREVKASLSLYQTGYDDLIDWYDPDGDPYTWDGYYTNIASARTRGVDLALDAQVQDALLGLTGSLLETEDDQGEKLLRRPETHWGARLGLKPFRNLSLDLTAAVVGERKDWGDVTLGRYTLVNLAGMYRVSEALKVFGRVENLTDEEYEEAGGYGTPGRAFYFGIKATL